MKVSGRDVVAATTVILQRNVGVCSASVSVRATWRRISTPTRIIPMVNASAAHSLSGLMPSARGVVLRASLTSSNCMKR